MNGYRQSTMIKIVEDKAKTRQNSVKKLETFQSAYLFTDEGRSDDENQEFKVNDSQSILPGVLATSSSPIPNFLSSIYVEQTSPSRSKYPQSESISHDQFTAIRTLFDNFYKYYPPSKVLSKAIATKLESLHTLRRKGLIEEDCHAKSTSMTDFNRYVNRMMNKTTDKFLFQKYNEFIRQNTKKSARPQNHQAVT